MCVYWPREYWTLLPCTNDKSSHLVVSYDFLASPLLPRHSKDVKLSIKDGDRDLVLHSAYDDDGCLVDHVRSGQSL